MMRVKKGKGYRFMVWVSGLALIAALYAWVAVAATTTDPASANTGGTAGAAPTKVMSTGAASNNPIDPTIQNMLDQKNATIQNQQNTAIQADLFDVTTLTPAQKIVAQHFAGSFCDAEAESGNCPTGNPPQTLADIKVSSIFNSSSYDAVSQAAAQAFVDNLFTPLDNSAVTSFQTNTPITVNMLTNNPALLQQYVQALSDETERSVPRQVFAEIMAVRTPPTASQGAQPTPSEMALMEQAVMQRWMNSTWLNNLPNLTPVQMQQEMLFMQSVANYMSLKLYQQGERQLVVNALLALQNYRNGKNTNAILNRTATVPTGSSLPADTSGDSGQ